MIRSAFLTLATTLFGIATLTAQSDEWKAVNNGIWGGKITAVAIAADQSVVIGTVNGIYRLESLTGINSFNANWRLVDSLRLVWGIEQARDGALYATNGTEILRSEDNGRSWSFVIAGEVMMIAGVDRNSVIYYDRQKDGLVQAAKDGRVLDSMEITVDFPHTTPQGTKPLADPTIYNGANGEIYLHSPNNISIDFVSIVSTDPLRLSTVNNAPFPGERTVSTYLPLSADSIITLHDDGVKRTINGGATWEHVSEQSFRYGAASLDGTVIAWHYSDRFAATEKAYRSDDFGLTWEACDAIAKNPLVAIGRSGRVVVGGNESVSTSPSCSEGWVDISRTLQAAHITEIVESPDGTLYATQYRRRDQFNTFYTPSLTLYSSSDGGDSWVERINDINEIVGIDAASNVYVRVDSVPADEHGNPHATILQSRDGGKTWSHALQPTGPYQYDITLPSVPLPEINPVSFQATPRGLVRVDLQGKDRDNSPCNEYVSLDSGKTFSCWEPDLRDRHRIPLLSTLVDEETYYFVTEITVGDPGFEVPIDTTAFLLNVFSGEVQEVSLPEIIFAYYAADLRGTIFAVSGFAKHLYRSDNKGVTWEKKSIFTGFDVSRHTTGMQTGGIDEVFYTGVDQGNLGPRWDPLRYPSLLRTGDGGDSWSEIFKPTSPDPVDQNGGWMNQPILGPGSLILDSLRLFERQLPAPENKVVKVTAFGWSTNNGASWEVAGGPLTYEDVSAILYTSKNVTYIGTRGAGLFRMETPLSDLREGQPVHTGFGLELLPMPVLNHARLYFTIDESSQASIVLYNSLGQQVRTIDTGQPQPGTNIIPVDFSDLPAGAYFLELVTEAHRKALPVLVR